MSGGKDPLALRKRESSAVSLQPGRAASRHQPVMQEPRRWARAVAEAGVKRAQRTEGRKRSRIFSLRRRATVADTFEQHMHYTHGQFNEEKNSSFRYSPLNFNSKIIKLSWAKRPQRTFHGARGQCAKRFERFQSTNTLVNNPFDGCKFSSQLYNFSTSLFSPILYLNLCEIFSARTELCFHFLCFRGHALYLEHFSVLLRWLRITYHAVFRTRFSVLRNCCDIAATRPFERNPSPERAKLRLFKMSVNR